MEPLEDPTSNVHMSTFDIDRLVFCCESMGELLPSKPSTSILTRVLEKLPDIASEQTKTSAVIKGRDDNRYFF